MCVLLMFIYPKYVRYLRAQLIIISSIFYSYFGFLIIKFASPFVQLYPMPTEGEGISTIFHNSFMIVRPPLMYSGYALLITAFIFSFALFWKGEREVMCSRDILFRLVLCSWILLTLGNIIGMMWSYTEVGWGKYWSWDPIENASLVVWLMASALVHIVLVMKKKAYWSFNTAITLCATFFLVMFSIYLRRSGILASVHSFSEVTFANSILMMAFVMTISYMIVLSLRSRLFGKYEFSDYMSENSLLLQLNVVFYVGVVGLLMGMIGPLVMDKVFNVTISFSKDFYLTIAWPLLFIYLVIVFLLTRSAGQKTMDNKYLVKQLVFLFIGTLIGAYAYFVYYEINYSILLTIAVGCIAKIIYVQIEALLNLRRNHCSPLRSLRIILFEIHNRYSMHIMRLGAIILFVGVLASSLMMDEQNVSLTKNGTFTFHGYNFVFKGINEFTTLNRTTLVADIHIESNNKFVPFKPYKEFNNNSSNPYTKVAIKRLGIADYCVVVEGWHNLDLVTFSFIYRPFVILIWSGGLVMILGAVLSLFNTKRIVEVSR